MGQVCDVVCNRKFLNKTHPENCRLLCTSKLFCPLLIIIVSVFLDFFSHKKISVTEVYENVKLLAGMKGFEPTSVRKG